MLKSVFYFFNVIVCHSMTNYPLTTLTTLTTLISRLSNSLAIKEIPPPTFGRGGHCAYYSFQLSKDSTYILNNKEKR